MRCINGPAISRIATFLTSDSRAFSSFIQTGKLSTGPIVTLLTNDHGRRVGSGLPSVLHTTTSFPSCRLILTNTPNVSPRCCGHCINKISIGVVFGGAFPLLERTRTTLIASKATALRATLFHIPRTMYCRAPVKGIVTFLGQRVLGIGCVSLIGLVTGQRIIGRLITSAVAMRRMHSRLGHVLCSGRCHHRVLRKCRCVTSYLKRTKTPGRTTHRVITLLEEERRWSGGWRFIGVKGTNTMGTQLLCFLCEGG